MKKICFITYDFSVMGGTERVSASVANALSDIYEVHMISLFMAGKEKAFPLDERVKFFVALEKEDRLRHMRKALRPVLREYFRKNDIRVAFIEGMYPGWLVSSTCKGCGTKLVYTDHEGLMSRWDRKDLVFIRFYASRKCERTVVLTEQTRRDFIRKFRLPKKKVLCIYNWIEPGETVSERYDLSSRRMISAGRLSPEKGFERLIEAAAPVLTRHPDWHLDIFGDGEEKEKLAARIRRMNMTENIHLKGAVTDLDRRYKEYAMYILPSEREGMPVVLLEAKVNRLPIISFDILTGPAEIITDGANGILIEPFEIDKMSKAMEKLIEDPGLRQRLSDHSQDDLERFSKEKIKDQWIRLIEELS